MKALVAEAHRATPTKVSDRFLWGEWCHVVDPWQLATWEAYRDVKRLGRKTRLPEAQRQAVWGVFERVLASLRDEGMVTLPQVFARVADGLAGRGEPPYAHAVIDEAQDIGVAELRFLAALGGGRPDSLFFAGDLGQRIFRQPFSWKALGVDVRGRSHTLRINYRTSHQIRAHADRLLGAELADVDGVAEKRSGTVSVFNGPAPVVRVADIADVEVGAVGKWIATRIADGCAAHEVGVFVRSEAQLPRARDAVRQAGANAVELGDSVETKRDHVSVSTMHRAKGLEFRAVAVMACDDEIVPLQERIETAADDSDLQDVYDTERQLLYVACTRARDHLLVTGVEPASEFLEDLRGHKR